MSLPNHLDSYEAELNYFEQALEDKDGLRVRFQDHGQANIFTLRMHQARALQRALHRRIYTADDPRHGRSEFDKLTVRQPRQDTEDYWWVYIERTNANVMSVETLSQIIGVEDA